MQPPDIQRLKTEDFPEEQQALVERIATSLNGFIEQMIFLLSKRVDFKNLNQFVSTINVVSGSTNTTDGSLKTPVTIRTDINGRIIGVNLINLTNCRTTRISRKQSATTSEQSCPTINLKRSTMDGGHFGSAQ
jgi:hypothetical protein